MAKKIIFVATLAAFLMPRSAWAERVKVSPEQASFLSVLWLYSSKPAVERGMWPGFDVSKTPLVLCEEDASRCVVGWHPSLPPECNPVLIPGNTAFYSCPNLFRGIKTGFMLHYPYAGSDVAVFHLPSGSSRGERMGMIMHEVFHIYQGGFAPVKTGGGRFPVEPPAEALALAFMEDMLLANAAALPAKREAYFKEFVAVRSLLMARYPEIGRATEEQETIEGVARYIEDAAFDNPVNEGLARHWLVGYLSALPDGKVLGDTAAAIMSDRLYYTGALQCLVLMDRLPQTPQWRQRVEKGESVFSLFKELVGAPSETPDQTAARLSSDSSYLNVLGLAGRVAALSSEALESRLNNFRAAPGLRLVLPYRPSDGDYGYSGAGWDVADDLKLVEAAGANAKTKYYDLSLSNTLYTYRTQAGNEALLEALIDREDQVELTLDDAVQSVIPSKAEFSFIELAGRKVVLRGGRGRLTFKSGVIVVEFDGVPYP